jgi:hypothetical protein
MGAQNGLILILLIVLQIVDTLKIKATKSLLQRLMMMIA